MDFPKQIKDVVYALLQEPTLDKFREFLHAQTGEHNTIDFKSQWIVNENLAKEILALANSKGGFIVFGVAENKDKSVCIDGLPTIKDHAVVSNEIKNLISSNLKYDIYDFSYNDSEYSALKGKHFQMLVVEDVPAHVPFLAKKESGSLKQNMIYVRRGTSCEIANEEELQEIFMRRLNYMHPINGAPLELDEHLKQLKLLYGKIEKSHTHYTCTGNGLEGLTETLLGIKNLMPKFEIVNEPNPLYPDEDFEAFVSRMIVAKKKKIERVLDLY